VSGHHRRKVSARELLRKTQRGKTNRKLTILEIIGRLRGVGALWDCVPRVCGGEGGCTGGGVPLGAVP